MIGGAFWFYSENHLGPYAGMLALLRETILFTLVGAAIQVIASWMIVSKSKSEARTASAGEPDKMNRKGERR